LCDFGRKQRVAIQARPMDRTPRFRKYRWPQDQARRLQRCAVGMVLALGFLPIGRTDSTFATMPVGKGPLSATAHLDFRVTVLPTLALSMQPTGVHVQGSGGPLMLQSHSTHGDGRAPASSTQLRPHRHVVDTTIPNSQFSSGALITIAAP
jgi:hypothetical protein